MPFLQVVRHLTTYKLPLSCFGLQHLPEFAIVITHHISHTQEQDSHQRRHTELGARESLRLAPQRGGEPLVAVAEALELARAHGLLLGVGALA